MAQSDQQPSRGVGSTDLEAVGRAATAVLCET